MGQEGGEAVQPQRPPEGEAASLRVRTLRRKVMHEKLMEEVVPHPITTRGLNAAPFNRRMRKTARPVVWEGQRAQSR